MMIGNIHQGTGFGGLLRYLYQGDKDRPTPDRVAWTEAFNLSPSDDPNRLAGIMRHTADDHSHNTPKPVKKPVIHISISWHADDKPSAEQMRVVATQVLERMKLADHQAVVVAHNDTPHRHLHIVANRARTDGGRTWDAWQSKRRLEGILRDLEREHGFEIVPGRLAPVGERPPAALITRDEYLEALRKGSSASPEEQKRVRLFVRSQIRKAHSWAELEDNLTSLGLRLKRRGRGLVVTDGVRMVKASRIDRASSKTKLEERFGQTFESWIREKGKLRTMAWKLSHHQRRRRYLDRRFRDVTDPQALERLRRIKARVDTTVRLLQGELHAAYRPVRSRILRGLARRAAEATGLSRPPKPSSSARTALTVLNLASRLLPPVASRVLRSTIRTADVLVRELGR